MQSELGCDVIRCDIGGHQGRDKCLQDDDRWCMDGVDEVDELWWADSGAEVGRGSQSVCGDDRGRQLQE